MNDIETRAMEADRLWKQGDTATASGNHEEAYRLYTEAHDLVIDCAMLHIEAHRKLRNVTRFRSNKFEYYVDTALLFLVPTGLFEFTAFVIKSTVTHSNLCRRNA